MTMRKLMIAAAAACGAVVIGYGALTIDPTESRAAGRHPAATPTGGEAGDAGRVQSPRECNRPEGIDRDCEYL